VLLPLPRLPVRPARSMFLLWPTALYTETMQEIDRLREILDLIVCPACHGRLVVASTEIQCTGCGRRYPVVDEIPLLIAHQ
jgi:uncharacterized protein